jgi:tetratricopeptide (TPR) repeat protein
LPAALLALGLGIGAAPVRAAPEHHPGRIPAAPALPQAVRDDGATDVRARLAELSAALRAARQHEGEQREAALLGVAERYADLADDATQPAGSRAEAAFRAGEVLRTLKRVAEADARFLEAEGIGRDAEQGREFAARGLLERAHLMRRDGRDEEALAAYSGVREHYADQRRAAAHAMTWSGKLLLAAGRRAEAAELLLAFHEAYPEYPAEAVRNADLVAVDQFEAGEEDAARDTLAAVRLAMEPVLAEGGRTADAVRKALEGMRVTASLSGD